MFKGYKEKRITMADDDQFERSVNMLARALKRQLCSNRDTDDALDKYTDIFNKLFYMLDIVATVDFKFNEKLIVEIQYQKYGITEFVEV